MQRSCNTFTEAFASRFAFDHYDNNEKDDKDDNNDKDDNDDNHYVSDCDCDKYKWLSAHRLGLLDHFPAAVHQQSRLGQVDILNDSV